MQGLQGSQGEEDGGDTRTEEADLFACFPPLCVGGSRSSFSGGEEVGARGGEGGWRASGGGLARDAPVDAILESNRVSERTACKVIYA
jgi:hypothetical protein